MDRILVLFFFLTCTTSAFAGGAIIPRDEEVLSEFNTARETVLYPFNFEALVWNIYKGSKKGFLAEFFQRAHDKELLVLQEAVGDDRFKMMRDFFSGHEFVMATAWINKRTGISTGVSTASAVKSSDKIWKRSYYREPIVRTPKMLLMTKYPLAGMEKKLLVVNIHAINFVGAKKFKHMLEQARSEIVQHMGPVLFAGDFNTHLNSRYTVMQRMFKELNFSEVKFSLDQRSRVLGRYLDFAFVRGLKVFEATAPSTNVSDHSPLLLKLGLF